MPTFLITFLKFFTVGGFGFGFDMLTTWIFKEKLKLSKYVSNSIGFAFGILFRFVAHRFWTFQDDNPEWLLQMVQFGIVAIIGLPLVNGVIYLLQDKWKLLSFYKAKIVAMIVFMVWNFSASYLWVFA